MTNLLKISIRAICTFIIVAGLSQTLQAQSKLFSAKVPFGFEFGQVHMQPGTYTIDLSNRQVMILRGGSHSCMLLNRPEFGEQSGIYGRLVFEKYGAHYVLREAWIPSGEKRVIDADWLGRKEADERAAANPSRVEVAFTNGSASPRGK
jgi:hypothetical protein